MKTDELTNLISIRNYVVSAIENPRLDRKGVNELTNVMILLEAKILSMLTSNEFKEYIGYENVQEVVSDVVRRSNLKNNFKK